MAAIDVGEVAGADERRPGRIAAAIAWVFEGLAMILMGSIAVLVFSNAISRYTLSKPLPWTEEVVTNLMVWLVAIGIVLAGQRDALINCDILTNRVSPVVSRVMFLLCSLIGASAMAYTAWLTFEYITFFGWDRSPVLRLPKGIVIGGVLFALAGLSATLFAAMLRRK